MMGLPFCTLWFSRTKFPKGPVRRAILVNYSFYTVDDSQTHVHFVLHLFPQIIAHFLLIRPMVSDDAYGPLYPVSLSMAKSLKWVLGVCFHLLGLFNKHSYK